MNTIRKLFEKVVLLWKSRTDVTSVSAVSAERSSGLSVRRPKFRHWREYQHLVGFTDEGEPVFVALMSFMTHMSTIGRTGVGKSSFILLLIRDYIRWGFGFLLCDPKGTLANDCLADIAYHAERTGNDSILRRVILIELSPDCVTSMSIFRWNPEEQTVVNTEAAVRSFFAKRADVIISILFRVMGEPDNQGAPRIKRILRAVLQAVGAAGLDLVESLTLLDPFAKGHEQVWNACRATGLLPSEVESDLQLIHSLKRVNDKYTVVEGGLNRLRALLSPLIRAAFSESLEAIDFNSAVKERKIILVNARETEYVSRAQAMSLIAVVLHSVIEARFSQTDRDLAKEPPFPIFCDEAADYFGDDCTRVLRKGRSLKMPLMLFTQNFSAYRRDDADHTETVANECGVTICFQSKTPTPEVLNILLHGAVSFERATRITHHPDGYDFVALPNASRSTRRSFSLGHGQGTSEENSQTIANSEEQSRQIGQNVGNELRKDQHSSQEVSQSESTEHSERQLKSTAHETSNEEFSSYADHHSKSTTEGNTSTEGTKQGERSSVSQQSGTGERDGSSQRSTADIGYRRADDGSTEGTSNYSDQKINDSSRETSRSSSVSDDRSNEEFASKATQKSTTTESGNTSTTGHAQRNGTRHTTGTDRGTAKTKQSGKSASTSSGTSQSHKEERSQRIGQSKTQMTSVRTGGSKSDNQTVNVGVDEGLSEGYGITPLARHRKVLEELPQLAESLEVQREKIAAALSTLGVAEVLMRDDTDGFTKRVKIRNIQSPYENEDEHFEAIERVKAKLRAMHDFMTVPDVSRAAEQRRIQRQINRLSSMAPNHLQAESEEPSRDDTENEGPFD